MDDQHPYQKVTLLVEDFGTGKLQKVSFYKTSHLEIAQELIDEASTMKQGTTVSITMKSFASHEISIRIEQPTED